MKARVIGEVKSIENGKFYARSVDGAVRELHVGEKIYLGETVVGDSTNPRESLIGIKMIGYDIEIGIDGSESQTFDLISLAQLLDDDQFLDINEHWDQTNSLETESEDVEDLQTEAGAEIAHPKGIDVDHIQNMHIEDIKIEAAPRETVSEDVFERESSNNVSVDDFIYTQNVETIESSFDGRSSMPTVIASIVEDRNDDGYINANELNGSIDVEFTFRDARAGDRLHIINPDGSVTEYTLKEDDIAQGKYIASFPAPAEGADFAVSAVIEDPRSGNTSLVSSDSAMIDTAAKANDDRALTNEDSSIHIDVLANDESGSSIVKIAGQDATNGASIIIKDADANIVGTAKVVNGAIEFTPDTSLQSLPVGESKNITFEYEIGDKAGNTNSANVSLVINGVNDDPLAEDDMMVAQEDARIVIDPKELLTNDTDIDKGDSLSISGLSTTSDTHGNVAFVKGIDLNTTGNDQAFVVDSRGGGPELLGGAKKLDISLNFNSSFDLHYTYDNGLSDGSGEGVALLSYAVGRNSNEVLVFGDKGGRVFLIVDSFGKKAYSDIRTEELLDGKNHDLRVTWNGRKGEVEFYLDDVKRGYVSHYQKGHTIKENGVLMIGQEQDALGGKLDTDQIFSGRINDIKITTDTVNAHWEMDSIENGVIKDVNGNYELQAVENLQHTTNTRGHVHALEPLHVDTSIIYTPDADYHGPASFSYTVSDGHGGTDTATVSLDVVKSDRPNYIYGTDAKDTFVGSSENDIIHALRGKDRVDAGDGNDTIYGEQGADTLKGGDGDDLIYGGAGNDKLYGEDGDDIIYGGNGKDKIIGGAGDDMISDYKGSNKIDAGEGNDRIETGKGNDKIAAGSGDDIITTVAGRNTIDAGEGNDRISGGAGKDKIIAGDGDDFVDGGAGNDNIKGGSGDDLIIGGGGNDKIDGGEGIDTAVYTGNQDDYTIVHRNNGSYNISGSSDGTDKVTNVEAIKFEGDDSLFIAGTNTQIDLGRLAKNLEGINEIRFGEDNQQISVKIEDVFHITDESNKLIIHGDGNDSVVLKNGDSVSWIDNGDVQNTRYHEYQADLADGSNVTVWIDIDRNNIHIDAY